MIFNHFKIPYTLFLGATVLLIISVSCKNDTAKKETITPEETKVNPVNASLKNALTLYASFDNGINADFALGDAQLYSVPNRKARDSAQVGLHKQGVRIAEGTGRFGDGLIYAEDSEGYIYYPSKNNIAYNTENWEGAISFWLSLDPATDLDPGYCDPIQITDVSYNDAAIWVDFTKENPRDFRLGVIGDRNSWNPEPKGPDNENPIFIEQLKGVSNPPFAKGTWTHILINYTALNTDQGKAALYMNGELKGIRKDIKDPFTWELEKSNIYLGLGYIGLMDELSIYNKHLSQEEITTLYSLEKGVHQLLD
ncbi:LamG-like jellyroll fold domain-containing protein [uncultured Dokdonia sp.]|uniref:LamG-like jellyroll fold domain-containing protein n=1 Tax=uncultured Dokdonia sp. TaxID=575653 RepID=UPI00262F1856|nr:LamG-like jellyroll fold domain-containing protein [uncultured Dokdonia sp.]